jgi:hypothetical protein
MSFVNDVFDKQNQHRRGNFTSPRDHVYAHQQNHFQKHRERQGEGCKVHDTNRTYHHDWDAFTDPTLLLRRLVHNKTLLVLVGLVLIIVLGLAAGAFAYLVPMVSKLSGSVDISNWQVLLDQGAVMLQKILAIVKGA